MWIILLIIVIWAGLHLVLRQPSPEGCVLIAHRGAAGLAPENTLEAVRVGVKQGAPTIEIDIHRSADGKLVVMHDKHVDRTTDGHGEIGKLTWAEISKLDAGSKFSTEFAGVRVPLLDDILNELAGQQVKLLIEVKDPHRYPGIEDQLVEMIAEHKAMDRVLVGSFDHEWLWGKFHGKASGIPIVPIAVWFFFPPQHNGWPLASFYWVGALIDPTLIRRLRSKKSKASVWTVDSPLLMRLMIWLGADAVTTNRPDLWPGPRRPSA